MNPILQRKNREGTDCSEQLRMNSQREGNSRLLRLTVSLSRFEAEIPESSMQVIGRCMV